MLGALDYWTIRTIKRTTDWQFGLAFASRRALTTSKWPARDAICRAVLPFFEVALTSAPLRINSFTTSVWPSFAAKCSAVKPVCKGDIGRITFVLINAYLSVINYAFIWPVDIARNNNNSKIEII